ncbi:MAG: MCP four helix bundle domain-containing protein [Deltaproteobacteria bacterium]|nr:MCP four helix bundle domain-containing protein [Deltaproteobacteria bacterium]
MKFFKNLSIGRKIVAILMLIVAIEVLIALCGLHFLRQMQGDLHRIVDRDAESVRLAGEMQANMLQIVRAEKNMILSATEEERTRLAESIAGLQADLREAQIRLKELSDPDEKVLLDEFDGMWSRFMEADEEIRRLSALERKDEAAGLSMGNARELRSAAGDLMQAIVKKNVKAFEEGRAQADRNTQRAVTLMIVLILASLAVALTLGLLVSRSISASLNDMVIVADAIAQGNLDVPVEAKGKDETGRLGASIRQMQSSLRKSRDDAAARDWLKTGIARLNDLMRGEQELTDLSAGIISEIVTYLGAQVGAFYLMDNTHGKPLLRLTGSYAYSKRKNLSNEFGLGEGLVGQAALEKKPIVVRNVPEDYIKVTSGLGEAVPRFVSVFPFLFDGRVKGLVEIGALDEVSDLHFEYLKQAMPAVAISIETAQKREQLSESLARAQALTEELEAQQEELKAANEELEEQTRALRESEEKLKAQQEELEATNEELEEKTEALERQKRDVERTNRELERARGEIEERAEELAIASKYKSEFLANMSHELRTPLNSLLLLSKSLADNKEGTLTGEQIESARVIYDSGNQLLSLINEILDLSKIEAGRMELHLEKVGLDALANSIQDHFAHMAKEKGLGLHISLSETAPKEIETDRKRAEQIIRNLMSNAIKFTEAGDIRVLFGGPRQGVSLSRSGLDTSNAVAVSI